MSDVVIIEGPDAASYLQGQITQDVRPLADGAATWTLVLEPNGRVHSLARLARTGEERYELTVDDGYGPALRDRLARFKLRVKADLSLVEGVSDATEGDAAPPTNDAAARVAAGWPTMGREIEPGETIPAETGVNPLAVSFTKGCYTGQELVERMDARQATAPRRLVRLSADARLIEGQELTAGGKVVGRVTTAAGHVGLGYVARSVIDGRLLDAAIDVVTVTH